MHKARKFNGHGSVEGEYRKVGVDVVKHAVGSIHLRSKLSNHTSEQNHCKTSYQENINDPLGKTPKLSTTNRGTRHVDAESNEDNHKLTSHQVTVKIVTNVANFGGDVSSRVAVLVELKVDGCKSNQGSLTSLNHTEPEYQSPQYDESKSWVHILGHLGLLSEDQPHDDYDTEDKKNSRVDILDEGTGVVFSHCSGFPSRRLKIVRQFFPAGKRRSRALGN
mmetsp:Transcript_23514/g.34181  ORF Transcript_23514/g.34181 Transcript_23514/m.34181 type:complete len:221 (-) Transcript_23514:368-1030(-)